MPTDGAYPSIVALHIIRDPSGPFEGRHCPWNTVEERGSCTVKAFDVSVMLDPRLFRNARTALDPVLLLIIMNPSHGSSGCMKQWVSEYVVGDLVRDSATTIAITIAISIKAHVYVERNSMAVCDFLVFRRLALAT